MSRSGKYKYKYTPKGRSHSKKIGKRYTQTSTSNKKIDKYFRAKKPGWRPTKGGGKYFEARKNRSDVNPKLKL